VPPKSVFEQPVERHRKASDWVLDWLRENIISGRLQPGAQLPLVALAEQVGLSTTPIREALSRLRDEGLVVGDSHRTFRVASMTLAEIGDYYLVHAFLSGVIAERAATTLSAEVQAELRTLVAKMHERRAVNDDVGVRELGLEFHRIVTGVADDVLRRFVTSTSRLVARRTDPDSPGAPYAIDEVEGVLNALVARDGHTARARMQGHVTNTGQAVLADLRERGWTGV
jgi:DNA-binding GntR family transcriptional regulator